MTTTNFGSIYLQAREAGLNAGRACTPSPMTVRYGRPGEPTKTETIEDGACGFAWVRIPGTSAFAKWAKANKLASPGYPRGLDFWISDHDQSVARKAAHARAFADVLIAHGIPAVADSRLD